MGSSQLKGYYSSGVHQGFEKVGHQDIEAFIKTNRAIKYRMCRAFETFMEGYGEYL